MDFGAGVGNQGGISSTERVSVGQLAFKAASYRSKGERLLHLARFLKPRQILELGTHLGISAAYLLKGNPDSHLISIEGDPVLSQLANEHLRELGLKVDLRVGQFEEELDKIDWDSFHPELVFLDGNHRYEPTVDYFDHIVPHVPDGGWIILDDLHWSPGMKQAWDELRQRNEVGVGIDLWQVGLLQISRKKSSRHYVLWGLG